MREEQAMYRRLLHRRVYRLPPLPTLPGQVKRCRHCHGGSAWGPGCSTAVPRAPEPRGWPWGTAAEVWGLGGGWEPPG